MAKVQFRLEKQKYMLEFLPDCRVQIIQSGNENRIITIQYFADAKVMDFMQYVKSLDFSLLKDNEIYTMN